MRHRYSDEPRPYVKTEFRPGPWPLPLPAPRPRFRRSKMAVVLRQNFSWFLIAFIFFASFAAAVVFGIHFEDPKYATVMISWGVTLMWTWLLIEPLVIFVTFIVPFLASQRR